MKEIFETFQPKSSVLKKYIHYYYLDVKPNNSITEFDCFPHFNNTISIYKSHRKLKSGEVLFDATAKPFQIFTPIREKVLHVKQKGKVHRIVIVFYPLGIQQFYKNLNFGDFILDYEFLIQSELEALFCNTDIEILTKLLDNFFEERLQLFPNSILENSIRYIFDSSETFSVAELSKSLQISRQHLNRVFKTNFGVSIKKFHEIVIFRSVIKKRIFEKSAKNLTELAYHFNFADQSHLNKSYKNLTDNPPKTFFAKGTILGNEDTFWHL